MIHLGKSYRNELRTQHDNKENVDHNVFKLKQPVGKPLKQIPLVKNISETTTHCSDNPYDTIDETLKEEYTNLIYKDYSNDIFEYISEKELGIESFMAHHNISTSLRAKMVDWMIEVLSSYKMSEETFFKSVALMDLYLKKEEKIQDTKDIHLIGIAAMFSAMKFEQIHPLRLSLIAEKIARKKFEKKQIIDKESRMLCVLNFELEFSTVFDLLKHLNCTFTNNLDEIKLNFQPKLLEYLQKILIYLSKMCTFNHELITRPSCILASAIYFIGLKTLEQVNKNFSPEEKLPEISKFTSVSEEDILAVGRQVLHLAKSFSKSFPSLSNLKKFNRFEYNNE